MSLHQQIVSSDPEILGGKPCLQGTRISVEFLLELLAGGADRKDILDTYPQVTRDGFEAAMRHAGRAVGTDVTHLVKVPA